MVHRRESRCAARILLATLLLAGCRTAAAQCTCKNGTAATGKACPRKGAHVCKSCKGTHKIDYNGPASRRVCIYKRCLCPCGGLSDAMKRARGHDNDFGTCGVPYEGKRCPVNGDLKWCGKCFAGFAFSKDNAIKRCDVAQCTCKNGYGATGKACNTVDNEKPKTKCARCKWDFKMANGACVPCNCKSGTYCSAKKQCTKCPAAGCQARRDCAGLPGGKAKLDICGVCKGNGSSCARDREAARCRKFDIDKDGKVVDVMDLLQLLRYFGDVGGKCRGKLTTVQWKQDSFAKYGSKSGKGGRLMNAEIGDKLKFYFNYRGFGTGSGHDVFLHPSGTCDTKGAKELANIKQLPFVQTFTKVGKFTFACHRVNMMHCKAGMIMTVTVRKSKKASGVDCTKFNNADLDGNGAVQVKDLLLLGTAFGARC